MTPPRPQPEPVAPGEESVWDYPRPPAVRRIDAVVRVEHHGETVAESRRAWKVMETAGAPCYYLPPDDVRMEWLRQGDGRSWCEWKGRAKYWDLHLPDGAVVEGAAWSYPDPTPGYAVLRDHLAFYAGKLDRCVVDGEEATPQPGGFYGGWVTSWVRGPFKGGSDSQGG